MSNERKTLLALFLVVTNFYSNNACWMEGVSMWTLPQGATILDTFRGNIFYREIRDIDSIINVAFWEGLNSGPYVTATLTDSHFVIATNDAFENYEEYETLDSMSVNVNFRCSSGSDVSLMFMIEVEDTNNNAPRFLPSAQLDFTIFTPLPPGSIITGCFDGITVRDIDLTTERIDFAIEENAYFEIIYDADATNTDKEFIAVLKTTTFIRSLPDPITFVISATDVDRTGDPPLTTTATVTIRADSEFELPEEPVFTQTYYFADYINDNQIILEEIIALQSGFDDLVQFSLEGEFAANFQLIPNGNQLSLSVVTPLSTNAIRETQIYLVVRAERDHTSGDSAAIVVRLPEGIPLEFERAYYEGTIENNILQDLILTLTQGYEGADIYVQVLGEYSSYFTASIQGNTITLLMEPLSNNIINENNMIFLEIVANSEFNSAKTIATLEIIKDDNMTPIFNRLLYEGSYNTDTGLALEQIVFDQGYDDTVELSLVGEYADLFEIMQEGFIFILTTTTIPPEIFSEQRILLTLQATKPRTVGANAAVVISLPAAKELSFEESTYRGTLQNNVLSLEPIILSDGYDDNILFSLTGDYANYFILTASQNQVILSLGSIIPENIIQENNLIILTIEASGLNAITTTTSALVDIIKEDVTTPVFSRNIYYGTYQGTLSVNLENINLTQGFGDDITFGLEGDHAQYFGISNIGDNVLVSLISTIPEEVIYTEKKLIFNIVANKPLTVGAHAAIVIRFSSELTDPVVLRFTQNSYNATVENNILRTDNIILSTGYQPGTDFLLTGDYVSYFTITSVENVITLLMVNELPINEIESAFITLEIEARRERAISTWTNIIIDIVKEEIQPLVFSNPYYQGIYNEEEGTFFIEEISVVSGYDDTVTYALDGDFTPLFTIVNSASNTPSIVPVTPIPDDVLQNNNYLIFAIIASKPNANNAYAALSIAIERELIDSSVLGFDRVTYVGTIQDTVITLEPITLIEGYTDEVTFSLQGDLAGYFTLSPQGAGVIGVTLPQAIPDQLIPPNRLIVLDIRASAPQALAAHATIVFEVIVDYDLLAVPQLVFDATYYTGSYTDAAGVSLNTPISLAQGYDQTVEFALEGDQAQWFDVVPNGNSVTLIVMTTIPSGVLANNPQLVFVITAQRLGSDPARATIVITVTDELTDGSVLGFDRVTYVGTIQDTVITLEPITLIEGYTDEVTFSLQGDLAVYFTLSPQGAGVIGVTLPQAIPDQLIPPNRLIVLDIRASAPQALAAHATIVFEVIVDDDLLVVPQLVFDATYYTGTYTDAAGVSLNTPISLAQGYDQTVEFALEGDQAQWFDVVPNGNSVTLIVTTTIPSGVLANNPQLVFVITAQRLGSDPARATIVITVTDELTDGSVLGFDRVTYVGTIQDTVITLEPITLIEGYTDEVTFSLQGDLAGYFTLSPQGAGVIGVTLPQAIPDQLIPPNRLIVLDIRASAPQALAAHATIVFEVIVDDDLLVVPQLVFDATYYTGTYTDAAGVSLNTPISLAQGYDQTVEFALEGDQAQWFDVVPNGNSVTLIVTTTIPSGVLANNPQLVFVITAQRLGSDPARATIVITVTDELTDGSVLGFDRVTYVGTVQDIVITLEPITLIEGYTDEVTFSLQGDLAGYFTLSPQGAGVIGVTLPQAIPDQLIPPNRLIVLDIRASAPQALAAHATIVFEVIVDDDLLVVPQLVFDATYYTGTYTDAAGVLLNTPISLAQGYDQTVEFALEGDQAQWFDVVPNGNSVTLIVTTTIPSGVLANNPQLVFVITAQRLGSDPARATIVITVTDELTDGSVLGFDRVTYVGTIQDTVITLEPITLIEGYTDEVTFSLQGDLAGYFTLSPQGAGVIGVTLPQAIPDQLIPPNRLIVLDIRASAPQALAAHATIVFEVIVDDDLLVVPQLVFDATYYTGTYTDAAGVSLNTPISLAQGYDQTVEFALEGDQAQWFDVVPNGNSVTLIVTTTIPSGVLANNHQLVFVITAQRLGSDPARATIVITVTDELTDGSVLGFDRVTYVGTVQDIVITLEPITLIEGYTDEVTFSLQGDLAGYFTLSPQGAGVIGVTLPQAIPDQLIPPNRLIVLDIRASAPQALAAHATIVFEVIVDDDLLVVPQLVYDATYYTGTYTDAAGVSLNTPISLAQGYDRTVEFALEGDQAQWFDVVPNGNSVTLIVTTTIPSGVLANNPQLVFVITAQRLGSDPARATIVITVTDELTDGSVLGFDRVTYVGTIQDTVITLEPITLIEGYTDEVTFSLQGDLAGYFTLSPQGAGVIGVTLPQAIPDQLIPPNRLIVLDIRASAPQALAAHATIVFEVIVDDDLLVVPQLVFNATYYTGTYTDAAGVSLNTPISLAQGYDQTVEFALEGDLAQWFDVVPNGNSVTLIVTTTIPSGVLANNPQLVFVITAQRLGSDFARATIVITVTDELTDGSVLGFDRVTYVGTIQDTVITLEPITLIEGYTDEVTFSLQGDLAGYFTLSPQGAGVISVTLPQAIPDQLIPPNRLIVLDIRASAPQALAAHATIVFEVKVDDDLLVVPQLVFDATYYTGTYTDAVGITLNTPISLAQGYDQTVEFVLEGDHAQWFDMVQTNKLITLITSGPLPTEVVMHNSQLVFIIAAQRLGSETARATIIILLNQDSQTEENILFNKLVYEGIIQVNIVQHEQITIFNYDEETVQLHGEYSSLFVARMTDGVVVVQASGSLNLPDDVTHVVLELHAADARAVLLLYVIQTDVPSLPSVTFSSSSYVLNVEIVQTGLVGRVLATADNGESITYSLSVDNAHLQTRISINNEGELYLSASANSGVYTFQVIATTVITRAEGTAMVYLTVEAVTVCGDNEIVVPPLIVLDRDEEEPHNNLVTLNTNQYEDCHFILSNRWPHNQDWLYVDESGLHARSIDREHESIAFMALSQIQVELVLHCENDTAIRSKRSTRTDWLGPYDYGTSTWILSESIPYNSRRSLVNLIVNDINDNYPIFIGKDVEPIAIGYPIKELEERILPRSLAELQATDADIGENAALIYWSSEDVLAVEPSTGFVHVRSGAQLENNQRLTVSATDQNGQGLTGNIELMVKLLDLNNILIITIRDAFLNDENKVLTELSQAVGYELKTLRSVVISDELIEDEEDVFRSQNANTARSSLLLYVYGLIQREPVLVDRLTTDINDIAVIGNIVNIIPLEDYLELEIMTERDIGFMVATIVLSILLFIIIALVAAWIFIRWRRSKNYDEFSDENSLASRGESVEQLPKPNTIMPRLNIDELIKSEKRLQDMLSAPIEEVSVESKTPRREVPVESIIDLSPTEQSTPIVIQSIDKLKNSDDIDNDEFGESSGTRRKSVVTFNENVEKIIHVEDNDDDDDTVSSQASYEIYKL